MKKVLVISLVVLATLAFISTGYGAAWTKALTLDFSVLTGIWNQTLFNLAAVNDIQSPPDKDPIAVGTWTYTSATQTLSWSGTRFGNNSKQGYVALTAGYTNTQALTFTANNFWVGDYPSVGCTIKNNGTVPVKITAVNVSVSPNDGFFTATAGGALAAGTILDAGAEALAWVNCQGLTGAATTYTVTVSFTTNTWNQP